MTNKTAPLETELPELPPMEHFPCDFRMGFTADQMRAYALSAIAADRASQDSDAWNKAIETAKVTIHRMADQTIEDIIGALDKHKHSAADRNKREGGIVMAEDLLRCVFTRPDLTKHGREQFLKDFMEGKEELTLCWGDFRMMAAKVRSAAPVDAKASVSAGLSDELLKELDYHIATGEKAPKSLFRQVRTLLSSADADRNKRTCTANAALDLLQEILDDEASGYYETRLDDDLRDRAKALITADRNKREGDYSACCDTPSYCSSVRRCTAKDSAAPVSAGLSDHDQGIIRDLEVMAADKSNGFWPQALAIGALRIIRALSSRLPPDWVAVKNPIDVLCKAMDDAGVQGEMRAHLVGFFSNHWNAAIAAAPSLQPMPKQEG